MNSLPWTNFDLAAINNQVPIYKKYGISAIVDQEGTERGWCTLNVVSGVEGVPYAVCVRKIGIKGFLRTKTRWLAIVIQNPDAPEDSDEGGVGGCAISTTQASLWTEVDGFFSGRPLTYQDPESALADIPRI